MKALVKKEAKPGLWLEEVSEPEYGPNDLLIKIKKTAICGTDVHIYEWDKWAEKTIPTPMTVGHEFVGVVEAVGSEVKGFKVGDRVSGEGHLTCGHCRNCRAGRRHLCPNTKGVGVNRTGCFSEHFVLPAGNAFKVPDDIDSDIACILDPLGNAVHTALSFDLVGEDVLITGAGPIGIMSVAIAKHAGARHIVITDPNESRLALAREFGATRAVNPFRESLTETMEELEMTEGFDVGLEMSGNEKAFSDMLNAMIHGGKISLLGIFPDDIVTNWHHVIFKGLIIKGIYGREMYETWYKMSSLLQSGLDVSGVITHRLPVEEYEKGFELMKSKEGIKIILEWE